MNPDIETLTSITHAPEEEWDRIVPSDRLICTHRYLKAVEESRINDCAFYYPVLREANRIVAHTCVYVIRNEIDTFARNMAKEMIARIRSRWRNFLIIPTMECGTPVAIGHTISFAEGTDRRAALSLLASKIEMLARRVGVPGLIFRDFDGDLPLFDKLLDMGYTRVHNLPSARLAIRWNTFDEYLAALRHSYRRRYWKWRECFDEAGITVETLRRFAPLADELARLWRNVYDRAREYRRENLTPLFFRKIDEHLGDESVVLLLRMKGQPVAFALLLQTCARLDWIFCGLDYGVNEECGLYFNLNYEIVRLAIGEKVPCLDLGITTLDTKKMLGAAVVPLHVYMKHLNPIMTRIAPRLFAWMTPQDRSPARCVFKNENSTE